MINLSTQREQMRQFLRYEKTERTVDYDVVESTQLESYTRHLIHYDANDGDVIPAYLLIPDGDGLCPAVLLEHQHNGERHFGKSEPVGLVGDPLQNFGEALAIKGFVVLAADSICFEDRRKHETGTTPHPDDGQRQYDEMCFRLIQGDTMMRKVLH